MCVIAVTLASVSLMMTLKWWPKHSVTLQTTIMTPLNELMGDFRQLQKQLDSIIVRMQNLSAQILVEAQRTRNKAVFSDDFDCQDL